VEAAARPPFTKNPDFRAASFSPRETLDLKILASAARMYEEITGKDVNVEEGAISEALKALAAADQTRLVPLEARLTALKLPGATAAREQLEWMTGILDLPADDCVKTLAGDGKALLEGRQRCSTLEKLATEENIQAITSARGVLAEQWPALQVRQPAEDVSSAADKLTTLLDADSALEDIEAVRQEAAVVAGAYRSLYTATFEKRQRTYDLAREEVKGHPDWLVVAEKFASQQDRLDALLAPLSQRADVEIDLPPGATLCRRTGATIGQLESDIEAVEVIAKQVLRRVMDIAAPEEKVERLAVAKLYPGRLSNEGDLDAFLSSLRERLEKAISQGSSVVFE